MQTIGQGDEVPLYRFAFANAEFDEVRGELRVGGLVVELEHRPLQVLTCPLHHVDEVVPPEELFDTVWAGHSTVDNVLASDVAKLRKTLGAAGHERIVNVSPAGYRLCGPVECTVSGRRLRSRLDLSAGQSVPGREHFRLPRRPWIAVTLLALLIGLGASLWEFQRAWTARDDAQHQAAIVTANNRFLNENLLGAGIGGDRLDRADAAAGTRRQTVSEIGLRSHLARGDLAYQQMQAQVALNNYQAALTMPKILHPDHALMSAHLLPGVAGGELRLDAAAAERIARAMRAGVLSQPGHNADALALVAHVDPVAYQTSTVDPRRAGVPKALKAQILLRLGRWAEGRSQMQQALREMQASGVSEEEIAPCRKNLSKNRLATT